MPKATKTVDEFSVGMGQRIFELRKKQGLTQVELADRAGLSHQYFSCVERGEKGIASRNLMKLANALQTSADYLLTGEIKNFDDYGISQWAPFLDKRKATHLKEIIRNCLLLYHEEDA